jgi:2-dehydro-3-deoxy-D-gluconate 5-dehydrogenase
MSTSNEITALLDLSGRTAVVTGGAMGIGKAVAEHLGRAGANVVIADADAGACEIAAKELGEHHIDVVGVPTDVSVDAEVQHMVRTALSTFGAVDILVNNAGIFPNVPVLEMSEADFRRVLDVNLVGLFLCSRAVARWMVDHGRGGRIVNVTSVDALHPSTVGLAHYDASKHGAWGFTKNLALELAPHRIWVNAVAPGAVATPGVARMTAAGGPVDPTVLDRFLARVPMGRMGEPDDIARLVLVLASDLASYMTGSQVVVDGGVLLS